MNCRKCGKQIDADSKFCEHCGASVVAEATPQGRNLSLDTERRAPEGEKREIKTISIGKMLTIKLRVLGILLLSLVTIFGLWVMMIYDDPIILLYDDPILFGLGLLLSAIGVGGVIPFILVWKYKPGKTFPLLRWSKDKMAKIYKISLIGLSVLGIALVIGGEYKSIFYIVGAFVAIYYTLKSIEIHEDIDYSANDALTELAEMSIAEKVMASYQNFDNTTTQFKKNNNIIVVTNRKIFFAVFDGKKWMKMIKLISEVRKIGYNSSNSDHFFRLIFSDNTSLNLRLCVFDKITTTPKLFLKQFLSVLDAYLLGADAVPATSRRRVTVETGRTPSEQQPAVSVRNIEINPTLFNQLKKAEEIPSGRVIEI